MGENNTKLMIDWAISTFYSLQYKINDNTRIDRAEASFYQNEVK